MCFGYGWALKDVEELSEIEVFQHLENLYKLKFSDKIENTNLIAMATAIGQGDKAAHKQLKKLSRQVEEENSIKKQVTSLNEFSEEELLNFKWQ